LKPGGFKLWVATEFNLYSPTVRFLQSMKFSNGNSISSAIITGMHPAIIPWYARSVHGDQPLGHKQKVLLRIWSR
jgi:hypothetical protein